MLTLNPQRLAEGQLGLPQGFQDRLRDQQRRPQHSTGRAHIHDLILIGRELPSSITQTLPVCSAWSCSAFWLVNSLRDIPALLALSIDRREAGVLRIIHSERG